MSFSKKFWRLALVSGLILATAACGSKEAEEEASDVPEGMVDIGGPGRPATLDEAVASGSQVALWAAKDDDTTVYLLGTVHLMKKGVRWKTEAIKSAFRDADAVYLQADLLSKDAQRAMGVVVSDNAENPDGTTLGSFFSKKEKERAEKALSGIGLEFSKLGDYRPWFAGLQVNMISLVNADADPSATADVLIAREMAQRKVPVRYLETAAHQISLLASGEDKADAAYLINMVSRLEKGTAYYADLIGAWFAADLERLDFMLNGPFNADPGIRERLLVDRNLDWAQQIDRLLTDEPGQYVVAVGAGHLVGEESLQEILEGRGYDIVRVD